MSEQRKENSAWTPLKEPIFRALWIATVASNIGTWMQDVGAAWLMTSLAPSPLMVALVEVATTLPMFMLALPAGALADIFDRRRLLLITQGWMLAIAAGLGVLTLLGITTPWLLLAFTFLLGLGAAMNAPAWQAIVPELVTIKEIHSAVALNSVGFNISRAIGPALGLALTLRYPLIKFEGLDLSPTKRWPTPTVVEKVDLDQGPVLVTIEYRIDPTRSRDFARVMKAVSAIRLRDGAIRWNLFKDTEDPGRYLETFIVESWIEHLRQHERVTISDHEILDQALAYHTGNKPPAVSHFIAEPLTKYSEEESFDE